MHFTPLALPLSRSEIPWLMIGSAAARREGSCPLDPAGWLVLRQDDLAALETEGSYRTVDRVTGQARITVSVLTGRGWQDVTLATTGRTLDPVTNVQPNVAAAVARLRALQALPLVASEAPVSPEQEAAIEAAREAARFERELTRERLDRARCLAPKTSTVAAPAAPVVIESAPGVPVLITVSHGRTLEGKIRGEALRKARAVRAVRDPRCLVALAALATAKRDVFVAERLLAEERPALRSPWASVARNMVLAAKAREAQAADAWLALQLGVSQ